MSFKKGRPGYLRYSGPLHGLSAFLEQNPYRPAPSNAMDPQQFANIMQDLLTKRWGRTGLGASNSSQASVAYRLQGPVQYVTFEDSPRDLALWRRIHRHDRGAAHILEEIQPWRHLKKEKAFQIKSSSNANGVSACEYFGFDIGSAASSASTFLPPLNPFYLGTTGNNSDIGYALNHMGFTYADQGNFQLSFEGMTAAVHFTNNTNVGCDLDFFYCRPRSDNSNSSQVWESCAQFFTDEAYSDGLLSLRTAGLSTSPRYQSFGSSTVTPYQSSGFCSKMKIYSSKKGVRLGPGETCILKFRSPALNGVFNTEKLWDAVSTNIFSRSVLVRARGQIGLTQLSEETSTPAYMPINLLCVMHEWIRVRNLPVGSSVPNVAQASGAPQASTTDANNIVIAGNTRPPEQMEEGGD